MQFLSCCYVSAFSSLPLVTKGRWHGVAVTEGMRRCTFCCTSACGALQICDVLIPSVAYGDSVSLRLGHGVGLTAHRAVIQHHAAASLPWSPREAFRWCERVTAQKQEPFSSSVTFGDSFPTRGSLGLAQTATAAKQMHSARKKTSLPGRLFLYFFFELPR